MKENVFFRVGFSTYLEKNKEKKEKWTSLIIKKLSKYKFLYVPILIAIMGIVTNCYLIYRFITILEKMK